MNGMLKGVLVGQAAKGVGKALRAFAPTLQELTSVSRDLKNTLDNELGIDEIRRDLASAQVSCTGRRRGEGVHTRPMLHLHY